jgi:hypothetical protein
VQGKRKFLEVRMKRFSCLFALTFVLLYFLGYPLDLNAAESGYHSPEEINQTVREIAKLNKNIATLHELAQTPGVRDMLLLELGSKDAEQPAILVVANMEGSCPIASEAALELSKLLVGDWVDELDSRKYYIMPIGNPDGYFHFFEKPLFRCSRNALLRNDDNDDASDEDGPEDLNGDGYITLMRQAHPEGAWVKIEDNPILMRTAESGKGEKGEYRIFTEGIDNDGDGRINEDGPGGVNPGRNFPHNFKHYTKGGGRWAASEVESRAVMRFALDHPEIAMVLTFGRTNSLKSVPESSKKAEAGGEKYKLPEHIAEEAGLDPDIRYTLPELVEMGKEFTGYEDLTEDMVLQFLGVGAAVNPDRNDLPYWSEISERYNDFIKEAELNGERLDPPGFSPGCVEEWAYYQYGVPSFSMDFWTVPVVKKEEEKEEGALTPDEVEKMSNEEFIELGAEKIGEFLKASGAPAQYTAEMVIMALQGGMMTTKKMAEMVRKMKKKEEAGGADEMEQALYDFDIGAFVQWEPYDHPTLGEVEIGGKIPYSELAPPADSVPELLSKQLLFVRELAELIPKIAIEKVDVKRTASDVWKVDAWITNNGFLPYPTYQGERCQRPTPVIATIEGKSINLLEGKERKALKPLSGSGGVSKTSWLIRAGEGSSITIQATTRSAGTDKRVITLTGGGE